MKADLSPKSTEWGRRLRIQGRPDVVFQCCVPCSVEVRLALVISSTDWTRPTPLLMTICSAQNILINYFGFLLKKHTHTHTHSKWERENIPTEIHSPNAYNSQDSLAKARSQASIQSSPVEAAQTWAITSTPWYLYQQAAGIWSWRREWTQVFQCSTQASWVLTSDSAPVPESSSYTSSI